MAVAQKASAESGEECRSWTTQGARSECHEQHLVHPVDRMPVESGG